MKQEEKYMWAIVDGVKEKVSGYFLLTLILIQLLFFMISCCVICLSKVVLLMHLCGWCIS